MKRVYRLNYFVVLMNLGFMFNDLRFRGWAKAFALAHVTIAAVYVFLIIVQRRNHRVREQAHLAAELLRLQFEAMDGIEDMPETWQVTDTKTGDGLGW